MTDAIEAARTLIAAAQKAGASWWQCRHCHHAKRRPGRPLKREQAEFLEHEAQCALRPRA